jgi:hypothetical protein
MQAMGWKRRAGAVVLVVVWAQGAAWARQGAPPDYGIDFVTIGSPGNAGYDGPNPGFFGAGRGGVAYEYRIGRFEITTAQWMQFVNTFSTQGDEFRLFAVPNRWGAVEDPNYQGPGRRWMLPPGVPDAGMRPVFGPTWREAALYCNWLHNEQPADFAMIQDGAYDASTFTFNSDGTFNDQRTHNPGALFWIPTLDEWIKAAHFDPNRFGPGQPGYWTYSHGSEEPPIPGPPGVGETSAGYRIEPFGHFDIPLGAYPGGLSPWGLFDVTGGTEEWTEETLEEIYGHRMFRVADGVFAGHTNWVSDQIGWGAVRGPNDQAFAGLRIASVVPGPASSCLILLSMAFIFRRRRTAHGTDEHQIPGGGMHPSLPLPERTVVAGAGIR